MAILATRVIAIVCCIQLWAINSIAQQGFELSLSITNCPDSVAYLYHYYGAYNRVYKADSVHFTPGKSVTAVIKNNKAIAGGTYILLLSNQAKQLEVLLNNNSKISLSFNYNDPIATVSTTDAENTRLYNYQRFLYQCSDDIDSIEKKYSIKDSLLAQHYKDSIANKLQQYRKEYTEQYPNTYLSNVFNAMMEPAIPLSITDAKARYYYNKAHYWDGFTYTDNRLMYAPIYEAKLSTYYNLLPKQADTINTAIDELLTKLEPSKDLYKYTLWWLTRQVETSNIMGLDLSFIYLVENYYSKGKAFWLHDSIVKKYEKRISTMAPNVLGNPAPPLELMDTKLGTINLSEIYPKHEYTLIVFWSATCSHCRKVVPQLDSIVRTVPKDIAILGICADNEQQKWLEFIKGHKLGEPWVHACDPMDKSKFRKMYDVFTTPQIYLIDQKGIIVGKHINPLKLPELIKYVQGKVGH
jgi:peroxiredoxin